MCSFLSFSLSSPCFVSPLIYFTSFLLNIIFLAKTTFNLVSLFYARKLDCWYEREESKCYYSKMWKRAGNRCSCETRSRHFQSEAPQGNGNFCTRQTFAIWAQSRPLFFCRWARWKGRTVRLVTQGFDKEIPLPFPVFEPLSGKTWGPNCRNSGIIASAATLRRKPVSADRWSNQHQPIFLPRC